MRLIKKVDDWLAKTETGLLIFLLFLMVFLAFSQVLLRNFLHQGILWADVFLRQLVLWVGFLGASLAVRERRHIAIDFLPHFFSEEKKVYLRLVVDLATGIISVFLTLGAWSFLQFEMEFDSTLFLDIPVWLFQTILPFSFAMISLRYFLRTAENLTLIGKPKE